MLSQYSSSVSCQLLKDLWIGPIGFLFALKNLPRKHLQFTHDLSRQITRKNTKIKSFNDLFIVYHQVSNLSVTVSIIFTIFSAQIFSNRVLQVKFSLVYYIFRKFSLDGKFPFCIIFFDKYMFKRYLQSYGALVKE